MDLSRKKQTQKKGRHIYGTITSPDGHNYDGSVKEMNMIIEFLKSLRSKTVDFILLGQELHESGKVHYHYIIKYTNAVPAEICDRMYNYFNKLSGAITDEIIFTTNNYVGNVVGYCAKDGNYVTYFSPKCTIDLEYIMVTYGAKKNMEKICEDHGLKPRPKVLEELEIIAWLKVFMNKRGYKVNILNRELYGIDFPKFFRELESSGFNSTFGDKGLELCERHIRDPKYFDLPLWEPDINLVKFRDCFWDMDLGKQLSLEECVKKTPVIEYDFDFKYSIEEVKPFIDILENSDIDVEKFRKDYGRQFKKKYFRSQFLFLWGAPSSGKTTIVIPYGEVNKNVITEWTDDGTSSLNPIAKYPRIACSEVYPFDPKYNQSEMKKLGEGTVFATKKKHSNVPTQVIPKTGIFTSNFPPPVPVDHDIKAQLDRYSIYNFKRALEKPETDFDKKMVNISPLVMIWATSN